MKITVSNLRAGMIPRGVDFAGICEIWDGLVSTADARQGGTNRGWTPQGIRGGRGSKHPALPLASGLDPAVSARRPWNNAATNPTGGKRLERNQGQLFLHPLQIAHSRRHVPPVIGLISPLSVPIGTTRHLRTKLLGDTPINEWKVSLKWLRLSNPTSKAASVTLSRPSLSRAAARWMR